MKVSEARRKECKEELLKLVKPGDTVYCILKHVSASGMSRVIDTYVIKDNEPCWIGEYVADLLGWGYNENKDGVKVSGCNMDMGFYLVYSLSRALFHDQEGVDRPGYALNKSWL